MITIELNKKQDYETYTDFHNFAVAGRNFGALIRDAHPTVTAENSTQYIDSFYDDHAQELAKIIEETNNELGRRSPSFFNFTRHYFGAESHSHEYKGFLSIFNCNPRFVENETFQIYYKKDLLDRIEVAFHEVLHFIFFKYLDLYFKEEISQLSKNGGSLWELSEILNVILLNEPEAQMVLGRPEELFYPDLQTSLAHHQALWEKSGKDMKVFVSSALNLLSSPRS